MDKERFTMLLLDPGEIFFQDFSSQMRSEKNVKWIEGRLKLCSKSLVFVTRDINLPLIRIPLKETISIEEDDKIDNLLVECKQYIEMLEGNILAPYKFVHKQTKFEFSFNYVKVADCLPQMHQLLRAATLPTAEQNAMIVTIVHSIQSRFSFDTSWLEDLYEEIVCEVQANKVLPLIVSPGRVLLSTSRIYFQPYNNMDQHPVLKINLQCIKNVIKRRFLLRQVGIEIKWLDHDKIKHLFLSTMTQDERDKLYDNLLRQNNLSVESVPQNQMTMRWQNGSMSNYDYLLYINSMADRTFHDLTQYPVMPWLLEDYTSQEIDISNPDIYRDLNKPIGALEPNRLKRLLERYQEMSPPKFMYGSHYSAPGFVLFYLVRKYPQYMLCLQNGRFDHPDRMFNSVSDVWKNIINNMSDFKELIPEFYDPSNLGDFLVNDYGIDFGYRHDGTKIGDVQLPSWASSPQEFVQIMRNAMESDWVSKNLHQWIDLIFGYKQKGEEAIKANNVFFHLCYEGAVDLDTIKDINDRHGLEVQIMEFGQVPKQIFSLPHPKRVVAGDLIFSETLLASESGSSVETSKKCIYLNLKKSIVFESHKDPIGAVGIIEDCQNYRIVSAGHGGALKIHSSNSGNQILSANLSSVPLSCCVNYRVNENNNIVVVGSYDNIITFYNVEFGKIIGTLNGHEDAISSLSYCKSRNIIVSGSADCMAKVWRAYDSGSKKVKLLDDLVFELEHESKITSMSISRNESYLACGTEEGEISLWDLSSYILLFTVKESTDKINSVTFDAETKNVIACTSKSNSMFVIDVQTSTKIYHTDLEHEPLCMAWLSNLLLIGDSEGNLLTWNPTMAAFLSKVTCHQGPLRCLCVSNSGDKIVTGGHDGKVIAWDNSN